MRKILELANVTSISLSFQVKDTQKNSESRVTEF